MHNHVTPSFHCHVMRRVTNKTCKIFKLQSPIFITTASFTSCQVKGIAGSECREGVSRRQAWTADRVDGAPQSGAAAGQEQTYGTRTVDLDTSGRRSGCEWIWAGHLSELSLSTEVMWARLFPKASLLLGPEPPRDTVHSQQVEQTKITVPTASLASSACGSPVCIYLDFYHNLQPQRQM